MTATYNDAHIYLSSTITYNGALAAITGAGEGPPIRPVLRPKPIGTVVRMSPVSRVQRHIPEVR